MTPKSEAIDFWKAIGGALVTDWSELRVGEIFLLEIGGNRTAAKVTRVDDGSFDCRPVPMGLLVEPYKVVVR